MKSPAMLYPVKKNPQEESEQKSFTGLFCQMESEDKRPDKT